MASVEMRFNLDAFAAEVDALDHRLQEAVRPAAQAGAQVLVDQVRRNVQRVGRVTGNLEGSIYQVYSKRKSNDRSATYQISWNTRKAPHGHLVEYGHIQRYVVFVGKDGRYYTAVRPDARGKKRPGKNATQAERDAYYVLLAQPKQIAAQPFVRPAAAQLPAAIEAARAELAARFRDGA